MPTATNGDASSEKKGKKRPAKSKKSDDMLFAVEYAKSGRAGCRGCEEKILKVNVYIHLGRRRVCRAHKRSLFTTNLMELL